MSNKSRYIYQLAAALAAVIIIILPGMEMKTLAQSREDYVSSFVERMYTLVLGRESDPVGMDYWTTRILTGQTSGADCAYGFFESREYKDSGRSDGDFINTLYRTVLGRESEPEGYGYWMDYLAGGTPRSYVLAGFVNSIEYSGICSEYGVNRGSLPMNPSLAVRGTAGNLIYEEDGLYMESLSGQRLTGWRRNGGNRYYFDPEDGGRASSGWTYIGGLKYFFDEGHALVQDVDSVIGKQPSYRVEVNLGTQTVMIYAQDTPGGAYNIPVRAMVCSSGKPGHGTIQGAFPITRGNRWGLLFNDGSYVYGQYISVIRGNYLFHSCWYYENGNPMSLSVSEYNKLGTPASHGCIRLSVADSKWIYDNCAGTSQVRIFTSGDAAPFDRPVPAAGVVINGDQGYDPTDPSVVPTEGSSSLSE